MKYINNNSTNNKSQNEREISPQEQVRQQDKGEENRTRIEFGWKLIFKSLKHAITVIVYLISAACIWLFHEQVVPEFGDGILVPVRHWLLMIGIPLVAFVFFIVLLMVLASPIGAERFSIKLFRCGVRNDGRQSPILLWRRRYRHNGIWVKALWFDPVGIPLKVWEAHQTDIERMFHHKWLKPPEEIGTWTVLYTVKSKQKGKSSNSARLDKHF